MAKTIRMGKYAKTCLAALALLVAQHIYAGTLPSGPGKGDPVQDEIRKIDKTYGLAFSKGDSSLFLSCYAPDACLMAANTPLLCGKNGLLAFYRAAYRMGIRNVEFNTIALYGQTDDYVTEQGSFDMFDATGTSLGKGKFLVVWKKTAEGWKMFRDMFSNDAPPHSMK